MKLLEAFAAGIPVVAALAERGDVPIYLYGVGTAIAYNTVVVRSQIQGQITEINFKEGQPVRAGDQLALIDPTPYHAQVDQIALFRDAFAVNNVEFRLTERRSHFVLDHFNLGTIPDDRFTVFDRCDAADVHTHRRIKL